jgi:hypothetical protein
VADYKTMYFHLAANVANAIELLVQAQQAGEAYYVKENTSVVSLSGKEVKVKQKKSDGHP